MTRSGYCSTVPHMIQCQWFSRGARSPEVSNLGAVLSTHIVELDPNRPSGGSQAEARVPTSAYKIISSDDPSKRAELYSFRAEIKTAEAQQEAPPQKAKLPARRILTLAALVVVLLLIAVLAFPMLTKSSFGTRGSKPPALYLDMGNRRFDPAGLAGRLIARWDGSAAYQLYLDPLDEQQVAGFQSLAVNPPHPLSIVIRLLDASGVVACEKQIDFPPPAQPGAAAVPAPAVSPTGDTIQDMAGSDGQVAEITASGPLPCSLQAYQRLASWDFSANFPTASDQEGSLAQEGRPGAGKARRGSAAGGRGIPLQFQRLTAPIEGDDVIVGDNASRGTIDTSSGRVFWVVANVWRSHWPEWQIFPAAIHFRCEKTGICTLTRLSSRTMLQARLVR